MYNIAGEQAQESRDREIVMATRTTKTGKQFYIEPEQSEAIRQMSADMGLPEDEIIRQAIDSHVQASGYPKYDLEAWEEARSFIQALIEQGPVPGGRTWRREDLYERKGLH